MQSKNDIDALERIIVQLQSLHSEISQLAKKSPNDALNKFKLNFTNKLIADGDKILGDKYRPLIDFNGFDVDELPTNSDVTMIISQYITQAERLRSDNVTYHTYKWVYILNGDPSDFVAMAPTKVGKEK